MGGRENGGVKGGERERERGGALERKASLVNSSSSGVNFFFLGWGVQGLGTLTSGLGGHGLGVGVGVANGLGGVGLVKPLPLKPQVS